MIPGSRDLDSRRRRPISTSKSRVNCRNQAIALIEGVLSVNAMLQQQSRETALITQNYNYLFN
jgi:hypothetical protein